MFKFSVEIHISKCLHKEPQCIIWPRDPDDHGKLAILKTFLAESPSNFEKNARKSRRPPPPPPPPN